MPIPTIIIEVIMSDGLRKRRVIQIMIGESFSYEKVRALGDAATALAAELTGKGAVKSQCFA